MAKEEPEFYRLDGGFIVPKDQIVKVILRYGEVCVFGCIVELQYYFAKDPEEYIGYLFWPESCKLDTTHIVPEKFVYTYNGLHARVSMYSAMTLGYTYPICVVRVPRIKLDPYIKHPRY